MCTVAPLTRLWNYETRFYHSHIQCWQLSVYAFFSGADGPLYQCLGASGRPSEWHRLPSSLVNHREQAEAYNYSVSSSPNSNCLYLITYCHRPKQRWERRTLLLPWQPAEKIMVINQRREWWENTQPKQFADHPCLLQLYQSLIKLNFYFAYMKCNTAQKIDVNIDNSGLLILHLFMVQTAACLLNVKDIMPYKISLLI